MISPKLKQRITKLIKESLDDALANSTDFMDFARDEPKFNPIAGNKMKGEHQVVKAFIDQLKAKGVEVQPEDEKLLRSTLLMVLQQDKKYEDNALKTSPLRGSQNHEEKPELLGPQEDEETPSYYGSPRVR